MESHTIPILFYVFAFIAIVVFATGLRKLFLVRRGRAEAIDMSWGRMITNALVFGVGQKKVYRRRFTYESWMHGLLAWGFFELFFATTVDFFQARGWFSQYLPGLDTPWFAFLNDLGGLFLFLGLMMALFRRLANKPETLPQDTWRGRGLVLGDTGILLFLLLLVIGGFLSESARLADMDPGTASWSWIGYTITRALPVDFWTAWEKTLWWFHAVTALSFIAILPHTKMFHAVAVLVNIAVTDERKRRDIPAMHVAQLMVDPDMDPDAITLGASKVENLTWTQLLNGLACTECARCTMVCPASATDKLLSPMKIIGDVRQSLFESSSDTPLSGGRISEEELWSCTTCGACMEECPVLINHVPIITEFRRHLVLSEGKPPVQASEHLENITNTGNPWGLSDRLKWAWDGELNPPLLAEKKTTDVLYWVGCAGAFDPRNQQVARSMVHILEAAGVDYAILGEEETCTGDSARRLGEEYLFETMALQNIETLNQYSFNRIVTPCPHCLHTLKNEYTAFDGHYEVNHHTQFIQELLEMGALSVKQTVVQRLTYHDPCYLGRYNHEYDAPRDVLGSLLTPSNSLVEMEQSKSESFCCGAGGGNMWHEIDRGQRINLERFDQALNSGADGVVTACSFCSIMMDDAMKVRGKEDTFQVRDVAEMVAEQLTTS
ncbi:MAG: (Fe-S)-binding protein [Fidelibacterota bacterium]